MYLRLRTIGGLCIGESGRKFFPASQSPGVAPNTRNVAGNCNCRPRHGNQRRISLEIAPKSQPRTPVASPIAASNVSNSSSCQRCISIAMILFQCQWRLRRVRARELSSKGRLMARDCPAWARSGGCRFPKRGHTFDVRVPTHQLGQ